MAAQRRRSTRPKAASLIDASVAGATSTGPTSSVSKSASPSAGPSASTSASTSAGHDAVTLSVTSTTSAPSALPANKPSPRSTFRNLLRRGFGPEEAANLTAYLSGIPIGAHHWDVQEIDRLLFLRELQISGRFGGRDGATEPTSWTGKPVR